MSQDGFEIDNCKNDLYTIFLDGLISLYVQKRYDDLHFILIGNSDLKSDTNTLNPTYIDTDSIINVRVWTDEETKRLLDILHYVCIDSENIISLNNRIIELWLYEMNTEMSRFFYRASKVECNRDRHLTLKVNKNVWNDFTSRCNALNVTIPIGFKTCMHEFLEQKSKIFL